MSAVTVQLFASCAEFFGSPTLQISVSSGSTVGDLIAALRARPGAEFLPPSFRIAVNRKFAAPDQLVGPDDEVAMIPPVAGG